jgi:excisionase family DNA binding protein
MAKPSTQLDKLLSVDELAEVLGVHPGTIYRRKAQGKLPAVKLPNSNRVYFRVDRINKLIAECEQR